MTFYRILRPLLLLFICFEASWFDIGLAASAVADGHDSSRISYISFTSKTTTTFLSLGEVQQQEQYTVKSFSVLKNNLGSPLAMLDVPFHFLLFGRSVHALFVSPYGAMFTQPHNPCQPDNYFLVYNHCTLINSHYDMIAAFYAPLYTSTTNTSEYFSYSTSNEVTVAFQNVSVADQLNTSTSFRMSLHNDSRIELLFDYIGTNVSLIDDAHWLSGIRSPEDDEYTHYTQDQRSFAASEWGFSLDGVYPSRSAVSSGQQFTICPISLDWCLTPSQLSNDTPPAEVVIELRSLHISCVSQVQYAIQMTATADSGRNYTVPCNATAAWGLVPARLRCAFRRIEDETSLEVGQYDVQVLWQENDVAAGGNNFSALAIDGLQLNVTSGAASIGMGLNCSASTGGLLSRNTSQCGACSLCTGNAASCLESSTSCFHVKSTSLAAAFEDTDCTGSCPAADAISSVNDLFYRGVNGSCCRLADIDCNGECLGGAKVTKPEQSIIDQYGDSWKYCCAGEYSVNCDGVCKGTPTATYDICGTCGGNVTDPCLCYPVSASTLSFTSSSSSSSDSDGDENDAFHAVFDARDGIDGMQQTFHFRISNSGSANVFVFLSIQEQETFSPAIKISEANATIPAGASLAFSLQVSIEDLYRGKNENWELKRLLIGYLDERALSTCRRASFLRAVDITVDSENCERIIDSDTCKRMPGCSVCVDNDGMRILRGANGNDPTRRRLFTEFLPISMILDDDYADIEGECINSFFPNSDCPKSLGNSPNAAARTFFSLNDAIVLISILIGILITLF